MKSSPANRFFNSLTPTDFKDSPRPQSASPELPQSFVIRDHRFPNSTSMDDASPDSRRSSTDSGRFFPKGMQNLPSPKASKLSPMPSFVAPKEVISGAYYGAQDKAFIKSKVKKPSKEPVYPWIPLNDVFNSGAGY